MAGGNPGQGFFYLFYALEREGFSIQKWQSWFRNIKNIEDNMRKMVDFCAHFSFFKYFVKDE